MSDDLRTQVRRWFVETGYVDGGGMGHWVETKESVEVSSEVDAKSLRDNWLEQGKLRKTTWGELRPDFPYGLFRIRSVWEDTEAADEITDLRARLAEVELGRAEHHKVMSKRIAMQRKELRWVNAYTNAVLKGYNRILDAKNKAETRAERAEAAMATARRDALEEAMIVLDRNHGVPCTPVYPATWSHERLEAYQAGQMDAAASWKTQIRALKDQTP